MLRRVHPIAGTLALLTIAAFWVATTTSELSGSKDAVIAVKQAIPWGLWLLVPALAVTGFSGFRLGRTDTSPLVAAKRRRMPIIGANGLLVLVPCALYLARASAEGDLGTWFYLVQAIELLTGAVNLTLLSLNLRDGLRLTGRLRNHARKNLTSGVDGTR